MSESLIYCEGYHDRAFWKGWLTHLGCTDPGSPPAGRTGRVSFLDPFGSTVRGGHYAYHSPTKQFIRVVPCGGKSNVLPAVRERLGLRTTKTLTRLLINVDSDADAGDSRRAPSGLQASTVEAMLRTFDSGASRNADGEIELDGGATKVFLARWEVNDPPARGLPQQQTLERLVSAALAAVYPNRAELVQRWLETREDPPPVDPKEHSWSYMAGWFAEHGCDAFYSILWNDRDVVNALKNRLQASGVWQAVERLAR